MIPNMNLGISLELISMGSHSHNVAIELNEKASFNCRWWMLAYRLRDLERARVPRNTSYVFGI